jgi:hypothetical protein
MEALASVAASGLDDTADDELMARMLQLEYDKQYDQEVLAKEKQTHIFFLLITCIWEIIFYK